MDKLTKSENTRVSEKNTTSSYFSGDKCSPASSSDKNHFPLYKLSQKIISRRLGYDFFNQTCISLAKSLLGQLLVHCINGKRCSGYIVETECYLGLTDKASHSYEGKRTRRTEPMFMKPATSYVYSIYGMYYCFNITSQEEGSCVLIRALEPCEDLDEMNSRRQARRKSKIKLKPTQLTSGPSKLCQALSISKHTCNKLNMATSPTFWVEEGPCIPHSEIVISTRIGIESSGIESASKPLRFYVHSNPHVSVKDKKAESALLSGQVSPSRSSKT